MESESIVGSKSRVYWAGLIPQSPSYALMRRSGISVVVLKVASSSFTASQVSGKRSLYQHTFHQTTGFQIQYWQGFKQFVLSGHGSVQTCASTLMIENWAARRETNKTNRMNFMWETKNGWIYFRRWSEVGKNEKWQSVGQVDLLWHRKCDILWLRLKHDKNITFRPYIEFRMVFIEHQLPCMLWLCPLHVLLLLCNKSQVRELQLSICCDWPQLWVFHAFTNVPIDKCTSWIQLVKVLQVHMSWI